MVLATQNPIDIEGTYPLPEAQLDRFLFKLVVTLHPDGAETGIACAASTPGSMLTRSTRRADGGHRTGAELACRHTRAG